MFPSLTISGRVRGKAEVSLRYEMIKDLFLELSLTDEYDSKAQSDDGQTKDYSIVTSLGYSF